MEFTFLTNSTLSDLSHLHLSVHIADSIASPFFPHSPQKHTMSLDVPSLGETFTLTELPRIPDLPLSARVVIPESQKNISLDETDTIDLGISKLIFSSYVLKPTPKLVWSYPLSPSTIIDSMDVKDSLYLIGLTERKKSRLSLVRRTIEASEASDLNIPAPAVAIKFAAGKAYVLLENGDLKLASYDSELGTFSDDSELVSAVAGSLNVKSSKSNLVVFYTFISNHSFSHKNDLLFYITQTPKAKSLTYNLIALDGAKSFEIYLISSKKRLESTVFSYNDGVLYHFDPSAFQLTSRALMKPHEIVRSIDLNGLLKDSSNDELFSLSAIAPERLLLSHRSLIYMINFKYGSLLSEHTNHSGNQVYLVFSLGVQGNDNDLRNSFALYLNLEHSSKLCKLKLIQVDVGLNQLSESLGKAIKSDSKERWNGLPNIGAEDLTTSNKKHLEKMESVYASLEKAKLAQDSKKFDQTLLAFLKTTEATSDLPKYSHASDRVVDHRFIEQVLSLFVSLDDQGDVQFVHEELIPTGTLAYLLTHPLFPVAYTKGLLVLLSSLEETDLLKRAIQLCKPITIDELMTELINLTEVSEEISTEGDSQELEFVAEFLRATIDRLIKDHSLPSITAKLLEKLNNDFEIDNKKLERMLDIFINLNTNNSWTLTQAVIDVGGLFNWKVPTVSALSEVIDSKIEALTENSYNLTLTNQAILAREQIQSKKKKKATQFVVDNIHEITSQRVQLDAILTMSNNTTNKKLMVDEGIELAKQIPSYSKERLIF